MAKALQFVVTVVLFAVINGDTCTWQNCGDWKQDMLNVHLIAHTHDDAGWLQTVDQYYWGYRYHSGVQYILNTVIEGLLRDPKRKYSYCETGFFTRWWNQQHDTVRHQVRNLVRDGQLEFVNGGWVSNDEAAAHYVSIIEQMTHGLHFLNYTFGECGNPKVAWQVDPFGHSREQASLYGQMGMNAVYFSRLHWIDHDKRINTSKPEMVWHGSKDLGRDSDILAGIFETGSYYPPPDFCFDEDCNNDPIMDDPRLEGYNLDDKLKEFIAWVLKEKTHYRTNHIMVLMGGDFMWRNANKWFTNMDRLIYHMNKLQETNGTKINVLYSTPACYTKALNFQKLTWPAKDDDFFPYASAKSDYWTGYFTSRPTFKGFIRTVSSQLQTCKQLSVLTDTGPMDRGDIRQTEDALSLLQHHDAVSGTAKQHVTNDYTKRLYAGLMQCHQAINDAMNKLMPNGTQQFCPLRNETICPLAQESDSFVVTVYNAQAHNVSRYVRIPFTKQSGNVIEFDPDNGFVSLKTQVVSAFNDEYQMAYALNDSAPNELVFEVNNIPPLGFKAVLVTATDETDSDPNLAMDDQEHNRTNKKRVKGKPEQDAPFTLENKYLRVNFDQFGSIRTVTNLEDKVETQLSHTFCYYIGSKKHPQSGAYVFRPEPNSTITCFGMPVEHKVVNDGPLVSEVRTTYTRSLMPYITEVIRLYKDRPYIEFEWTVGPLPHLLKVGHEIVTRFNSDVSSADEFYTDANGRQMVYRRVNYQSTYNYENSEPVAGNYYPVNSRIYVKVTSVDYVFERLTKPALFSQLQDSDKQLTILNDRSQGGSSLHSGSIELMVHRRLFADDNKGVQEWLNEPGVDNRGLVVRGKHWLLFNKVANAARAHRTLATDVYHEPILGFAQLNAKKYRDGSHLSQFSGLSRDLPSNVHILTLEQWVKGTVLLRLEHLYQKDEDEQLSQNVVVDLEGLFTTFDVLNVKELTLAANMLKSEDKRWRWSTGEHQEQIDPSVKALDGLKVTLTPMQIRTFKCYIKMKQ